MWNRKELKAKGKAAFRANYWRAAIAGVVFLLILTIAYAPGASGTRQGAENYAEQAELEAEFQRGWAELIAQVPPEDVGVLIASVVFGFAVAFAIFFLFDVLLLNPLLVGCQRFFIVNSDKPAELKELAFGFGKNWKNAVKVMLLCDVYQCLWYLLFLIPGLVKTYSYRLVPYILADYPDISPKKAITLSRRLMDGHKFNAFLLDLSFLGWDILSALTMGLVGVFYANPYQLATNAELYKALRYTD